MDVKYGVLSTDGSVHRQSNGYGVHGYVGSVSEKIIRGPLSHVVTNKTYLPLKEHKVLVSSDSVDYEVIAVDKYIDIAGYHNKIVSAQVAEILAMDRALKELMVHGVTDGIIYTDSEYVRGAVNGGIDRWISNKWVTANGPRSNKTYLMNLYKTYNECKETLNTLEVTWVKAHNGNILNELADTLAGIGTQLMAFKKDEYYELSPGNPPKSYWDDYIPRSPLLAFKMTIFMANIKSIKPNTYYMVNDGGGYTNIGKKTNVTGYSVVKTKEPIETLDTIMHRVARDQNNKGTLCTIKLDKAYNKQISRDIKKHKSMVLRNVKRNVANYNTISRTPIVIEGYPLHLIIRGVSYLTDLENILDHHMNQTLDDHKLVEHHYVDVTDLLYRPTADGKSLTSTDLLKESGPTIKLPHPVRKATRTYAMNVELPSKTKVQSLAKSHSRVGILSWRYDQNTPLEYAFVIDSDIGSGIYNNKHISRIL